MYPPAVGLYQEQDGRGTIELILYIPLERIPTRCGVYHPASDYSVEGERVLITVDGKTDSTE